MTVHESPESASPSITRAVAAALTGSSFQALDLPSWQRLLLQLADHLIPQALPALVRWENKRRALPLTAAESVDIEQLANDRVADYRGWHGTSEAIVVGSALGGAAAYLASALQAPFLPEPFILAFQGGSADDRVGPHLNRAMELAEVVGANNPNAQLISHFDPVHDGWLTGFVNHLRLKLGHLPPAYRTFLKQHLEPGGTIIHLDCQARWLAYPLADNHRYQIGGWGGIGPYEYLEGSPRIDDFLAAKGSLQRGGWRLPNAEPVWQPESEWGSEARFGQAVQAFARQHQFRYLAISLPTPHHYSWLAYRLFARLWQQAGISAEAGFVGMFNQYDPVAALELGLLPLWLVFNTEDSLAFLQQMMPEVARQKLFFAALVTYSKTPDMVNWSGWEQALGDANWKSVGARPQRYPDDTVSLWRWQARLRRHLQPVDQTPPPLSVDDLELEVAASAEWRDRIPLDPLANSSGFDL